MNLYILSLLFSALLLYSIDSKAANSKHSLDECDGLDSSQPCHCFTGKYECLYRSKCAWKPSSECVTRDVPSLGQEAQPSEFPSYEPTPDPTPQPTEFITIQCGDTMHDPWLHDTITWRLDIDSDTSSLELNACNSRFDSILALYPSARSTVPIIASDDDCMISMQHGLTAGEYYLSLSALNHANAHGTYDVSITCQYEEIEATNDDNYDNKTQCEEDCDAFKIEMMYFDALSEYQTDYLNISNIRGIEDAICYTYRVERKFDDGVCREDVDGIVLGICDTDQGAVDGIGIDDTYLNEHIIKQIGGDLYVAYSSYDFMDSITGIKLDIQVSHEPIEFTLCLSGQSGVNTDGVVSHNVRFTRGAHAKKTYLCNDERNDGLPCFNALAARDQTLPVRNHMDLGIATDTIRSRVLWGILFVVLSVMAIASSFYHCVTRRAIVNKPSRLSDLDWAEIKVSDTMSDTENIEDDEDYVDRNTERDPLDPSTDNDRLSELSGIDGDETEQIGHLKQAFDDLSKKFAKHTSAERAVHNIRSFRNSVCSTVSENDETTILPVYHDYDLVNGDDAGYWANTDVYTSNNE